MFSNAFAVLAVFGALAAAAPRPETSADVVQGATTTYTFPDLVPTKVVEIASTGDQPSATDLPTIMKERDAEDDFPILVPTTVATVDVTGNLPEDTDLPAIMKERDVSDFPVLVPTTMATVDVTGNLPEASDLPAIMKEREAVPFEA